MGGGERGGGSGCSRQRERRGGAKVEKGTVASNKIFSFVFFSEGNGGPFFWAYSHFFPSNFGEMKIFSP